MRIIYLYDAQKMLVRPTFWDEDKDLPVNATDIIPPQPDKAPRWEDLQVPFLKLTFDEEKRDWYEAATDEEIVSFHKEREDRIASQNQPSAEDLLGQALADEK
jgi:hypothetical protein